MKKHMLIAAVFLLALQLVCAAETSVTPIPLGMDANAFIDAYNKDIQGLAALDKTAVYTVEGVSDNNRFVGASSDGNFVIQFFGSDEGLRLVIVIGKDSFDYKEFLAVSDRALSVVAPDMVKNVRNERMMTLLIDGFKAGNYTDYGKSAVNSGDVYMQFYDKGSGLVQLAVFRVSE